MPRNSFYKKNFLLFCLSANDSIEKFLHNSEWSKKQHNDFCAEKSIQIEYDSQEKWGPHNECLHQGPKYWSYSLSIFTRYPSAISTWKKHKILYSIWQADKKN